MAKAKISQLCSLIINYGLLAIVFLIPIFFEYSLKSYNSFDLFKAGLFRAFLSIILLAFIAKIFISGQISRRGGVKIYLLALAVSAFWLLSSLFSLHPALSFWGSYERQQGLYSLINYLLFFILLVLNLNDLKQIKRLIMAAVAAGALASIYGFVQFFGLDPLLWEQSPFLTGRIFSTLGQPNFFGQYLILILPLSIYCLFFIAKKNLVRFLVGLAIAAEMVCLLLTYSRAAWLGFLASAMFFLIIFLVIKRRKKLALAFAVLLLLGAGLIFSFNYFTPNQLAGQSQLNAINRLKSLVDLNSGSGKMRLYYWQAAIKEIKQENFTRLLVGYGPETLTSVFRKYYRPDWAVYETINTFNDRAHNWLFDYILAYGFFGLSVVLAFFSYIIFKTAKFLFSQPVKPQAEIWLVVAISASLIAYLVNNLFSFSLVVGFVYLYFILASLWFLVAGQAKKIQINLTRASKIIIWSALAMVVGLFIYLENINSVRADFYYLKAIRAEKNSDCRGILNNLQQAINLDSKNFYYREQYVFHGLNCFSSITDLIGRLALRDSLEAQIDSIGPKENWYIIRLTMARAYSLFGFYVDPVYYGRAEKIYRQLIADNPFLLTPYQDLGRMKMWQKNYSAAINLFKQGEKYLPPLNNPELNQTHRQEIQSEMIRLYENLAYSYDKLNSGNLAASYYEKALVLNPHAVSANQELAGIYWRQGELAKAIALTKRGFAFRPADYYWPLRLFMLYREKNDLAEAKKYLTEALKLAPENEELKKYGRELNN